MIVITKLIMFGIAVVCAVTLAFIVLDFVTDKVDRAYLKKRSRAPLYVARDKDGELWLYLGKPIRELYLFNNSKHSITLVSSKDFSQYGLNERDYDYLKWENEPVEVFLNMED